MMHSLGEMFGGHGDTAQNDTSASVEANTPSRRGRRAKDAGAPQKASKPLTASEANDLKAQLVDLLAQGLEDSDKLISHTNADKAEAAIWSTIDDREIEILADAWIDWGKSSVQGARIVKLVVSQWKKYQVAIILGPRFMETINFYAEHGMALPATRKRKQARAQASAGTRAQAQAAPVVDANTAAEQAQAAHAAQLAARRNLIASENTSDTSEGASNDAA